MKREEFAAVMKDYAVLYGQKLEKSMVEAWWEQFEGYTIAAFEYAMHFAVQDTYKFPTYGQVLKHANPDRVSWSGAKYGAVPAEDDGRHIENAAEQQARWREEERQKREVHAKMQAGAA